jgi:hypothetical protein
MMMPPPGMAVVVVQGPNGIPMPMLVPYPQHGYPFGYGMHPPSLPPPPPHGMPYAYPGPGAPGPGARSGGASAAPQPHPAAPSADDGSAHISAGAETTEATPALMPVPHMGGYGPPSYGPPGYGYGYGPPFAPQGMPMHMPMQVPMPFPFSHGAGYGFPGMMPGMMPLPAPATAPPPAAPPQLVHAAAADAPAGTAHAGGATLDAAGRAPSAQPPA